MLLCVIQSLVIVLKINDLNENKLNEKQIQSIGNDSFALLFPATIHGLLGENLAWSNGVSGGEVKAKENISGHGWAIVSLHRFTY
jgi:hypothetical protein